MRICTTGIISNAYPDAGCSEAQISSSHFSPRALLQINQATWDSNSPVLYCLCAGYIYNYQIWIVSCSPHLTSRSVLVINTSRMPSFSVSFPFSVSLTLLMTTSDVEASYFCITVYNCVYISNLFLSSTFVWFNLFQCPIITAHNLSSRDTKQDV